MSFASSSDFHLNELVITPFSANSLSGSNEIDFRTVNALTFPKFRSLLSGQLTDAEIVMIALLDGQIVALSILTGCNTEEATLQSISVIPEWRRLGIAGRLLAASEDMAKARGVRALVATYTSALSSTEAVKRLLITSGWDTPQPRILFCRGDVQHVHDTAPWMQRIKVPKGFSIFEWSALSTNERQELESAIERGDAPVELSPFYDEDLIDFATSVGMRHGDRIVGWQINHAMPREPGVLRYSRTFVYQEYQRMGRALVLIKEAIVRNAEADVLAKYPRFVSDVAYERPEMVRFYERHLIPVSEKHYSSFGSRKLLN